MNVAANVVHERKDACGLLQNLLAAARPLSAGSQAHTPRSQSGVV